VHSDLLGKDAVDGEPGQFLDVEAATFWVIMPGDGTPSSTSQIKRLALDRPHCASCLFAYFSATD
jgi:hypothetical protein